MKTNGVKRLACAALACLLGMLMTAPGLAEAVSSAPVEPEAAETFFELAGEEAPVAANDAVAGTTAGGANDALGVLIDTTSFPDANLRAWVVSNCDLDANGYLSDAEAAKHTSITVSGKSIQSLVGLEYFTSLTKLDCSNNSLTVVSLTNPTLTTLDCSNNTTLYLLDVSSNLRLTDLNCANCMLASITFGKLTALQRLQCQNNILSKLDIRTFTSLSSLQCQDNAITELSISSCPMLVTLCETGTLVPSALYTIYKLGSDILSFDVGVRYTTMPEVELYGNTSYTAEVGTPFQIVLRDGVYASKFSSENRKVAKVDSETGVVEPTGKGKTKIICKTTTKAKLTLKLTVEDPTMPTGIILEDGTIYVELTEEDREIEYELIPDTAVSEVTWKSSSTLVAKVKDGLIIPRNTGKTTITATTKRGNKTAKVKVEVVDSTMPTGIELSETGPLTCYLQEPLELEYTLIPEDAVSDVRWSCDPSGNARISDDGVVTFRKSGKVTIIATTKRGNKTAKLKVEVLDGEAAESVTIDAEDPLNMYIGETQQLTATVQTQGDYDPDTSLKWSSSNKKVATVSHDGLVTAKKHGSAKITVETKNGKKDSIHVQVN